MHRCFTTSEIRLRICQSLYEGSDRDCLDEPSLAALARSCQLFLEPATDVLWNKQSSLAPLAQVMPGDLLDYDEEGCLGIIRPIREEDWKRLEYYNQKIRHLDITEEIGISPEALVKLAAYRPAKTLLPRLQSLSLELKDGVVSYLEHIPILLAGSIRRIQFTTPDLFHIGPGGRLKIDTSCLTYIAAEPHIFQHLLRSIPICCPDLSELGLPGSVASLARLPISNFTIPVFIHSLRNLRSLSVALVDMTPELMRSIGDLPQLQELKFGRELDNVPTRRKTIMDLGDISALPIFTSPGTTFEHLKISYAVTHNLQPLLDNAPRSLKTFRVCEVHGQDIHLSDVITPLLRFSGLTSLELDLSCVTFSPDDRTNLPFSIISLHHLRTVYLWAFPSGIMTDDWLDQLARNWPLIESLSIYSHDRDNAAPSMTLEGLVPVAYHCEHLLFLVIQVLCRPFDFSKLDSRQGTSNVLDIELRGPIEQTSQVFKCINVLFPKLRTASGSGCREWAELNGMFREMFHGDDFDG